MLLERVKAANSHLPTSTTKSILSASTEAESESLPEPTPDDEKATACVSCTGGRVFKSLDVFEWAKKKCKRKKECEICEVME